MKDKNVIAFEHLLKQLHDIFRIKNKAFFLNRIIDEVHCMFSVRLLENISDSPGVSEVRERFLFCYDLNEFC